MIAKNLKYLGKHDTYKYVYEYQCRKTHKIYWGMVMKSRKKGRYSSVSKVYETARECAKKVDLYLINKGKEPINILKNVNRKLVKTVT